MTPAAPQKLMPPKKLYQQTVDHHNPFNASPFILSLSVPKAKSQSQECVIYKIETTVIAYAIKRSNSSVRIINGADGRITFTNLHFELDQALWNNIAELFEYYRLKSTAPPLVELRMVQHEIEFTMSGRISSSYWASKSFKYMATSLELVNLQYQVLCPACRVTWTLLTGMQFKENDPFCNDYIDTLCAKHFMEL